MKALNIVAVSLTFVLPAFGHADDTRGFAIEPKAESPFERPEQDSPLGEGNRVRIETEDGRRVVGTVSSWETSAVRIVSDAGNEPFEIEKSKIVRLDRSQGKRSHALKGALLGSLVGLAVPVVAGGTWLLVTGYDDDFCSSGEHLCRFAFGALVGGYYVGRFTVPIGAVVGGVMGNRRTDSWHRVPFSRNETARMKVDLTPAPGRGVAARVALSW